MKIYIASKTKHAAKWRKYRSNGVNIISTWIDEAGKGETKNFADLATRCIDEATKANRLVLFAEPGDVLKGALIEVGAALAVGVPVYVVGGCESYLTALNRHPLWKECLSLDEAFQEKGMWEAVADEPNDDDDKNGRFWRVRWSKSFANGFLYAAHYGGNGVLNETMAKNTAQRWNDENKLPSTY